MSKIFFAAIFFLFSFNSMNNFSLPIGTQLPMADERLMDVSGNEITLNKAVQDNGLIVMFSCNTCPFVIKNQQRTKEICEFAINNKIGVILLNANEANRDGNDSFEAMKIYAKKQDYKWFYAVDKNSKIADVFDANRTPECFLFNNDKKLVYHGAIDDNPQDASAVTRHHLQEAIKEMVGGNEVSLPETRSIGCAIKRAS